jgi:hypothetical protein
LGAWSYKLAEVVTELRRLDADVVLLQEVDWCHAPDDAPTPFTHDAFHEIASALGLAGIWAPHYAYRGTAHLSSSSSSFLFRFLLHPLIDGVLCVVCVVCAARLRLRHRGGASGRVGQCHPDEVRHRARARPLCAPPPPL